MPGERFITYARVSTQRQGVSGLGLEAQRYAVTEYLGEQRSQIIAEFVEIESGRKNNRPELAKALAACRQHKATLVVAKLDRLARNARFLLALRDSAVEFICADMPQANRLTIGIMAVVAEAEAEAISARTKAGMAAAKLRGVKLGRTTFDREALARGRRTFNAERHALILQRNGALAPIVRELRAAGARSQVALADGLNARGIPTPQGGPWNKYGVARLLRAIHYKPTLDEALLLLRSELRHRGGNRTRNEQIYRDRCRGRTLSSLAVEHGLTDERIRQICHLEAFHRKKGRRRRRIPTGNAELRRELEHMLMEVP